MKLCIIRSATWNRSLALGAGRSPETLQSNFTRSRIEKTQGDQVTCSRPLISSWNVSWKSVVFFQEKKTQNHWKQGKAKYEQVLGKSCGWLLISHFSVWILWGCECHKTELKGAPTAQGIKWSDLYQQNAEMGWTIGYMCGSSSTCHQQSSFFPSLSCFSMVSVHPRPCFSPGGKMATEVSELIVAYLSSQKERSILSSNSLKDWETIFSRSPSPESQPWHFIGLNWVICSFLSQSQWLGEHPPVDWQGWELFPNWLIPTLGDVSAFLRAPGWGKAQVWILLWEEGDRHAGSDKWYVLYCIIYRLATNCWGNSERKPTLR